MHSEYQELRDEMALTAPSEYQAKLKSQRKKIAIGGVISFFIIFVIVISSGSRTHKTAEQPMEPIESVSIEDRPEQISRLKTTTNAQKLMGFIAGGAQTTVKEIENGNPASYTTNCAQPNYLSVDGSIWAYGPKNAKARHSIKGVNWFGMETEGQIPFGLWANNKNGSTLYSIVKFLAQNKFNSVRLPVNIKSILYNTRPNVKMVNEHESRALNTTNYISTMQSVIKALAYRNISVMISLHALTPYEYGGLWYNQEISEAMYFTAVKTLTKSLCSAAYWNVLGLDLKNEPAQATWGTNDIKTDFRLFAQRIGNEMLKGCPNWLAFVEGIAEINSWYSADLKKKYWYQDWWGGGLTKAKAFPVTLSKANKVVYAPHYYTPAVYPADYFYGDNYQELPNRILKNHVLGTINAMFGYLKKEPKWPAMVMGEFGGLYTTDKHPQKTIQRTVNYTVELILNDKYSGGYVWSLNPESGYGYNPGKTEGKFQEGLVDITWRNANEPYLKAMKPLEKLPSFGPLKCFPK